MDERPNTAPGTPEGLVEEAREALTHELKTWSAPFQAVFDRTKRHEIRVADRDYRTGDTLHLREWVPGAASYTGREAKVLVTYLTPGGAWGLPPNICVMSIGESADAAEVVKRAVKAAERAARLCRSQAGTSPELRSQTIALDNAANVITDLIALVRGQKAAPSAQTAETKAGEMKPCCDRPAVMVAEALWDDGMTHHIACWNCPGAAHARTREEAIELWNRDVARAPAAPAPTPSPDIAALRESADVAEVVKWLKAEAADTKTPSSAKAAIYAAIKALTSPAEPTDARSGWLKRQTERATAEVATWPTADVAGLRERATDLEPKLRIAREGVQTMPNSAARLYGDAADLIRDLAAALSPSVERGR